MAKKSNAAKLTRKVASRKRKKRSNAALIKNPPIGQDLWEQVVPGIATYAGLRISGRIAYKVAKRKSAKMAKHAGALTPLLLAGAGYFAVHKIDKLKPYHDAFVVAAAIAVVQSLMQTYVPQWGWILNDYHLDDVLPMARGSHGPAVAAAPPRQASDLEGYEDDISDDSVPVDDFSDIPGMGDSLNTGIFAN